MTPDAQVSIIPSEPTPAQLVSWRRLWCLLLAPATEPPIRANQMPPTEAQESDDE
jgi:hypothetical protein